MRRLGVDAALTASGLAEALAVPSPLLLDLVAAPRLLGRLELLGPLARFDGVLVARFSGRLATPLAEAALLAPLAEWGPGAALDLAGALAAPLLARVGPRRAVALLLAHGTLLPPGSVLLPLAPGDAARSPLAVAAARDLLAPPRHGRRGPLARERARFAWLLTAGEKREGLAAFRQKRPPAFDW